MDLKTKNISYFDYEHQNINDDFLKVVAAMIDCETIVFATPVYWYNMSAIMKTFFDRMSDLLKVRKDLGRQLKGKKMCVIACSSDRTTYPALWEPFKLTAAYLEMEYSGHVHTWIESGQVPQEVKNALDDLISKIS